MKKQANERSKKEVRKRRTQDKREEEIGKNKRQAKGKVRKK